MDEKQMKAELNGRQKALAVLALVLVIAGAILLYPIGSGPANRIFLVVKACMAAGLLMFLFSDRQETGLKLWAYASVLACACTIYKWVNGSSASTAMIFLYIGSLMVDIGLPVVLYRSFLNSVVKGSRTHE